MGKNTPSNISNPQSLRVLIVEDSEDDALLEIRELKKGGYNPLYERVETFAAMKKALKEKQWDIILCDYKMPKFNGKQAIALLKETNIDIPLIIVSGTVGEETAIECMRSGANDYVMKDSLSRLCPAIARELEEAEVRIQRKRMGEDLEESENKYRLSFENVTDVIYTIDKDLNILSVSPSVERVLGYKPQDFIGQPVSDLGNILTPESFEQAIADINVILKGETISATVYRFIAKDGTIKYGEVSGSPLMRNGKIIGIISVARDITERKMVEEQLKQQADAMDVAIEGIAILDEKGEYVYLNKAHANIYGYNNAEELIGKPWSVLYDSDELQRFEQKIMPELRQKENWQGEAIGKKTDGRKFPQELSLTTLDSGGLICVVRDITERRQAEDALQESEKYFKEITENSSDIIIITDKNGNIKYCSRSIERFTGYKPEELIGRSGLTLIHPDDVKRAVSDYGKAILAKDSAIPNAFRIVHKDGSERYLEGLGKNLLDNPNVAGFIMNIHDITERKQADEALRESERKYKSLIDNFQDIILTINLEGKITFASQSIKEKLGYESAEMINMNILDFVQEEDRQRVMESLQKGMKGEKIKGIQTQVITKSGGRLFFESSFSRVYKDGAVVGAQAIIKDITESKRATEEVLREKHFSDAVIDSLPGIFYLIDKKGHFARFNKNMADVTGYSAHELSLFSATDIIKKEDRKLIKSKIKEAFNNGSAAAEASILTRDGREIPYYFTAVSTTVRDNIFITGMGVDITERRKMEETLRQSEERYRTILDEMADAYFEVDVAGNYTFVNDAVCHHLGYSREELIGTSFRDQMVKEELEKVYKAFGKIYITGKPERDIFYKLLRKNGTTSFAEMTGFPLKNQQEEVIGFRGVGRDVSERKKMEEALRQSEQRYRSILDEMEDAYFEVDIAGNYTFLNDACCRHLGYPREELIGTTFRGQMAKEDIGMVYDTCAKIFRTGKPEQISSYKILRKDKTTGYTKMTVFPLKNQQGKIIGLRGVGQDVTESKRAEEERKQSFGRMRKALGATVQSISTIVEMKDPYTSGHQQRVADLARSIAKEMGLSADQRDFIRTASAIHDIGKISIPAEILSKPTKLTDLEFNLIKTHSQSGYEILKDIEFPWPVADVVLQHHERMDGSGYPHGLKGKDILLEARIMAVADVVEAIASHRPYRPSRGIDFALEEISRNKGILYDTDVVDVCLKLFREKGYTLVFKKS